MSTKLNIMINDDVEYQNTPENFIRFKSGHDFMNYVKFNQPELQINILSLKNNLGYWRPDGGEIIKFLAAVDINPTSFDLVADTVNEQLRMRHFIEQAQVKGHFADAQITTMAYAKKTPVINLYAFK